MCAARHARGRLGLQEKWRTRACVLHTHYMQAATQPVFLAEPLTPNSRPVLSPRGRELERGQQAARLVFGRLGC